MHKPELIYQDGNLIVVSKPAGMPVHEAKHSSDYTLCDWLLERFPEIKDVGDLPSPEALREIGGRVVSSVEPYRPGIVHRLDKQTSGVMVIARNQESFLKLKEIFKSREVTKVYIALVCGQPKEKEGVIEKSMGRRRAFPTKMAINQGRDDLRLVKEAVTAYKVKQVFENLALLEVSPKTGRMHQIRVHLASIGHPVAGDTIYGGAKVCLADLGRLFLHATSLSFMYENTRLKFEADLPEELEKILNTLRDLG